MTSYKIGRKKYWRNKKTGEAYREGAFYNRKTHRGGGRAADGWMSSYRHNYNKSRRKH